MSAIHAVLAAGARSIEVRHAVHDEYVGRYQSKISQMAWAHPSVRHSHFKNVDAKVYTLSPWTIPTYWSWTRAVDQADYQLA